MFDAIFDIFSTIFMSPLKILRGKNSGLYFGDIPFPGRVMSGGYAMKIFLSGVLLNRVPNSFFMAVSGPAVAPFWVRRPLQKYIKRGTKEDRINEERTQ